MTRPPRICDVEYVAYADAQRRDTLWRRESGVWRVEIRSTSLCATYECDTYAQAWSVYQDYLYVSSP